MSLSADALFLQRTIRRSVSISGLGIHTGQRIQLTLHPAPEGSGIRFRRTDAGGIEIPARAASVSSLELATTLGRDDVTVSTVEHLMAAVHQLGIDNLLVELDGPEVPILDGSALPYVHLLEAVGISPQHAWRRVLAVTAPVEAVLDDKRIVVSPYPGLRLSYAIQFEDSVIGHQRLDLEVTRQSFERELAPARTFARWSDVQRMREAGFGLGGTNENCVVFDEQGTMNTNLRFADEPVRHKALDALGDLALLGAPMWGHVEVERGGHLLHYLLLEALHSEPESWTWVGPERASETAPPGPTVRRPLPAALPPVNPNLPRRRRSDRPVA